MATDLSSASDHVLGCLPGLRLLKTRRIILLHALGIKHLDAMQYLLASYVEPRIAQQKDTVAAQGFDTNTLIAPGLPVFEVNRVAAEQKASLIVVGSHGSSLAKETLLGGTVMGILHHALLPVLVCPAEDCGTGRKQPMHIRVCRFSASRFVLYGFFGHFRTSLQLRREDRGKWR